MSDYKNIENLMDDIVEIPFSIFYDKFIYRNNIVADRETVFLVWIRLADKARTIAFSTMSSKFYKPIHSSYQALKWLDNFKSY